MKKAEIVVGGHYTARVSGNYVTVRVDAIRTRTPKTGRDTTVYDVTNLNTGRRTTFRSAAKFRAPAKAKEPAGTRSEPIQRRPDCGRTPKPFGICNCMGCTAAILDHPKAILAAALVGGRKTLVIEAGAGAEDEQCSDPTASPRGGPVGNTDSQDMTTNSVQPVISTGNRDELCPAGVLADMFAAEETPDTIPAVTELFAGMGNDSPRAVVAGRGPTEEQAAILAAALWGWRETLVIEAGAGAGKTSSLQMLEEILPGRGQYTAFNKSLVEESKSKFRRAQVNTTHSLAFRAIGSKFAHRLGRGRMRGDQIARLLGIEESIVLDLGPNLDRPGQQRMKTLRAGFLASQVMEAIKKFCMSAEPEITAKHFRYLDGIDVPGADGKRGYLNNDRVRDTLLPFAVRAWADLQTPDGTLPFAHDHYVKVWQLTSPYISADYILLDEDQDTAEVMVDILRQQTHAKLILVGDENQSIYQWRGAVNATRAFPDAAKLYLTQSFRFGRAIADVANAILTTLEEPTELVLRGLPSIPSRVEMVTPIVNPTCVLCRTNAGAVGTVLEAIRNGKRPHLIGGGADVVAFVEAAQSLQQGRTTSHPELVCFESWQEVEAYAKEDEGEDLRLMVKLIKEFSCTRILDALRNMPGERDADVCVSTAHKSKGREWATVQLAGDFPTMDRMDDEARRLLYVAATRAKRVLDISQCPPFAGGKKRNEDGELTGENLPVIRIEFNSPMPTLAEATADLQLSPVVATVVDTPTVTVPNGDRSIPFSTPTLPIPIAALPAGTDGTFTWAKGKQGDWLIRGPAGHSGRVTVAKKSGATSEERLGGVVWTSDDGAVSLYRLA